jgi:NADH-quinone oxidoreductase subunit L
MTVPLLVLAVGAAAGGILGISEVAGIIPRFLAPVVGTVPTESGGLGVVPLAFISVAVSLAGIGLGWLVYNSGAIDWVALRVRLGIAHRLFRRGWFFDDVYAAVLVTPGKAGAAFLAYVVDNRIVDGIVGLIGRGFSSLAGIGRRVQTGLVRNYALAFLLGAVAILFYIALRT